MTEKTRYEELREDVLRFHGQHPKVWVLFKKFTLERVSRGFQHYSVNAIFERIRWETDQAIVDGKSTFKLNNNYRPFYARAFMRKHPEHEGFFRTRHQLSHDTEAVGLPPLTPLDFPEERV